MMGLPEAPASMLGHQLARRHVGREKGWQLGYALERIARQEQRQDRVGQSCCWQRLSGPPLATFQR